ncbi:MAG TPA: ATPase, T2SS/T4P/T4SS family [Solirubrobacteraceae bacterium]|nr:ATPase, T2SS/T4P/T4SS family [Solirubrobacteraceae bacterium]
MSVRTAASAEPTAEELGYPRGLVPPSQRGRSEQLIGDVIVEMGYARREAVERAVKLARDAGIPTGRMMLEMGALRHDQLARALAERFGVDFVDLSVYEIDMGACSLIPVDVAKRYQAVPIGFMPDRSVLLAMVDPSNVLTLDEISMITGRKVHAAAAASEDVQALLGRLNRLEEEVTEFVDEEPDVDISLLEGLDDEAPVIKLVYALIAQAVEQGASDIHCDPEAGDMRVLYRIDGMLSHAATIARSMAPALVSRIKIMSNMDIAERRVPQDGRLAVTIEGRRVDVRVATLPLVRGEGVVMRILDSGIVLRELESLGMREFERGRFQSAISKPHGAVLVTGPTGSGKSTTLYAAIGRINDGQRSILTIEDPVESPIDGIKQMQVSPKAGVTFASGLRSMLRADPDVIMVGEIRDRETAVIAVQAALTGHMVLSTLHTRDAASALTRMADMGIEPFMVAAAVDCVVAQRLARTLCHHCKQLVQMPEALREEYGLLDVELFEPVGCIRCSQTGWRGRTGLFEVVPMSDGLRQLVLDRTSLSDITTLAIEEGMRTMRSDGIEKVREGVTTLAEVARVTATL